MSFAVLFPGQGSQFVGMGAELFESRPDLLGEASDEILGWSLRDLCLNGPEDDLTRTEHAQPAIFAVGYALWESLRPQLPSLPAGAAGHSLGEYTALAAAGAVTYAQGLSIVAKRGSAMAKAADGEMSGMAALIGVDVGLAESVAAIRRAEGGRLQVANINAPGQVVVAGSADDIDWVAAHGGEHGVRRAVPLNVAGAFHSSFMAAAAEEVGEELASVTFDEPSFPVWSNTTAQPHRWPEIAAGLRDQVVSPVRYQESLESMAAVGINTFVHVGPGDVTAGMAKRSVEGAHVHAVSSIADIPTVVEALVTIA